MHMSRHFQCVLGVVAVVLATANFARADTKHRFLCIDNARTHLLCVDQQQPAAAWCVSIPPGSRDLQLLDGNRVLVSHGNGAAEYDLEKGRKLDWGVDRYAQVSSAQRLDDGRTILGANATTGIVIYELNRDGRQLDERRLEGLKDLRLLRLIANGNILLTVSAPCRVIEVTWSSSISTIAWFGTGTIMSEPRQLPMCLLWIADGNTFYRAENGVWLTDSVPAEYLRFD